MKKSNLHARTVRLVGEARIALSGPESALLVIGTGCMLRDASGAPSCIPSGTLLVRERSPQRFDRAIAAAIELMREKLEQPLRVTALARNVGMSRAAFNRRFVQATGFSPLRFLHTLRLERAAQLLTETDLCLSEIATRVGYVSEFAFSRAFKRHRGVPPSIFRRSSTAPRALALAA